MGPSSVFSQLLPSSWGFCMCTLLQLHILVIHKDLCVCVCVCVCVCREREDEDIYICVCVCVFVLAMCLVPVVWRATTIFTCHAKAFHFLLVHGNLLNCYMNGYSNIPECPHHLNMTIITTALNQSCIFLILTS